MRSRPILFLSAALVATAVAGACYNYAQIGAKRKPPVPVVQGPADWSKPDVYWSLWLRKRQDQGTAGGGRIYYASPGGNDENSGVSGSPWRTLQRAAATMGPGDTLLIEDGEYPGGIKQRMSGQPGRPITYRAMNVGKVIILGDEQGPVFNQSEFRRPQRPSIDRRGGVHLPKGRVQAVQRDAILVTGADNIVFEGLVVRNAPRAGIRIDQSNGCVVRWCRFLQGGTHGIFTDYSDDLLLEYNECAYSGLQHGIYFSNSGDRPTIRFNSCHDNAKAGIQLNGDAKQRKPELGTRGDGIIDGAVIENNVVYNNGLANAAAAFNLACVHNARIVNNLIFNNKAGGIALFNDNLRAMTDFGSKNNRIVHNTIYFRKGEGRFVISAKHGSTGNVIRDNILCGGAHGAYEYDDTSSFNADYNVLWCADDPTAASDEDTKSNLTFSAWKKLGKSDQHSTWAEPQFANIARFPFDLRPKPGSPAANRASEELGITADFEGKPRLRGNKRSIGALEVAP